MVGRGALNIRNLSHVLKSNVEKMPWYEIQKNLAKNTRMLKMNMTVVLSCGTN